MINLVYIGFILFTITSIIGCIFKLRLISMLLLCRMGGDVENQLLELRCVQLKLVAERIC